MRVGHGIELNVRQRLADGTPTLEVRLPWAFHVAAADVGKDGAELAGTTAERLDRDEVERLREACEDFLAGRPLPA